MLNSYASNAVLAKTRAKFGKRLTPANYQELLACHSVNEVAAYLKNHKGFAHALRDLKEGTVHRGRLESLLNRDLFEDFSSLSEFGFSVGAHLTDYMITRGEIQQLLSFVRHLIAGKPEEYIFVMSEFFGKHTPIDLIALSKSRSYDELLEFLQGTDFYQIFLEFRPENIHELDFPALENALYAYLYKNLFATIDRKFQGAERRELFNIFRMKIELENIKKIYRMKKYYHAGSDSIRSMLLPYGLYINQRKLNELLEAADSEKFLKLLKNTKYRNMLEHIHFETIDEMNKRIAFRYARKNLRFSTHASVVLTSYVILREVELQNIINIIEGKRYDLPVSEISKMLIGINI